MWKNLALVLALFLGACGVELPTEVPKQVKEVVEDVDSTAKTLETALEKIAGGFNYARIAAAEVCKAFPSTCGALADAQKYAEDRFVDAALALREYKEGRKSYDEVSESFSGLARAVNMLLDAILEAKDRSSLEV